MQVSKNFRTIVLLCFLCGLSIQLRSQPKKEFAAELEEANRSVYSDAKKAVALSTIVYKKAKMTETRIFALITMVNGYTALQQNGEALKYASETWKLARESDNIQHKIWALGLLGEQYQLSNLNGISRTYLEKAENLIHHSTLSKEARAVSLGNIYAIKGNGYKDEIDCGYAIKIYDMAIASYRAVPENPVARNNLALVFLEKGNCLLDLNHLKPAEENFQKAYRIATQNELEEYIHSAGVGLAKIASLKGDFRSAKASLEKILSVMDTAPNPKMKAEIYDLLKENCLALGLPDQYRFYQHRYTLAAEELNQLRNTQFENVLDFVNGQPLQDEQQTHAVEYIFYLLLLITVVLFGWELYTGKKSR